MPELEPDRMASLGGRVRWLDRYRRAVAVVVALIIVPVIGYVTGAVTSGWPMILVGLPALMAGIIVWWGVEVALASVTAVWETEFEQLVSERGLPRAQILKRRKA
jgi:hypothetical protein